MYSLSFALVATSILLLAPVIDAQGAIQFFSDDNCQDPTGPSTTALSGECVEANDTTAILATSLPSCDSGTPLLVISDLDGCQPASISPEVSSGDVGFCLFFSTGSTIGSAGFKCVGGVQNTPSATTLQSTPSTTSKASQSTPTVDYSPSTQADPPSGGGISLNDRIALGCGIGIGVGAIIVTIVMGIVHLHHAHEQHLIQLIPGNGGSPEFDGHEMPAWPPPPPPYYP